MLINLLASLNKPPPTTPATGPLDHLPVKDQLKLTATPVAGVVVIARLIGRPVGILVLAVFTLESLLCLPQRTLASRRGLQMLGQLITPSIPVDLVLL
jgi:hypothetical protein